MNIDLKLARANILAHFMTILTKDEPDPDITAEEMYKRVLKELKSEDRGQELLGKSAGIHMLGIYELAFHFNETDAIVEEYLRCMHATYENIKIARDRSNK